MPGGVEKKESSVEKAKKYYMVEYDTKFRHKILRDYEGNPIVFDSEEEAEVLADGLIFPTGRFIRIVETAGPAPENGDLTFYGLSSAPAGPTPARAEGSLTRRVAVSKHKAKGGRG